MNANETEITILKKSIAKYFPRLQGLSLEILLILLWEELLKVGGAKCSLDNERKP